MNIKKIYYNTQGSWHDDPIYMISETLDLTHSLSVFELEDKVMISGTYGIYNTRKSLLKIKDDLEQIPFKQRIEMMKNLEISMNSVNKFNL